MDLHLVDHHIDCRAEKHGCDRDKDWRASQLRILSYLCPRHTNLHDEAAVHPGVIPHQNSAYIADDLGHASQQRATHETPSSVAKTQPKLNDGADGVENDECDGEGVFIGRGGTKNGHVILCVMGPLDHPPVGAEEGKGQGRS